MTFENAMAAVANALGLTWAPEDDPEAGASAGSVQRLNSRRSMHTSGRTLSEAPR